MNPRSRFLLLPLLGVLMASLSSCGAYFGRAWGPVALEPEPQCSRPFTGVRTVATEFISTDREEIPLTVIGILDMPFSLVVDLLMLPAEGYCAWKKKSG